MSQEVPVAPEASPGGEGPAKRKNLRQVAGFLAVGLFNTVVNVILLIMVNKITSKISEDVSFV